MSASLTIGMPVFNDIPFIEASIRSILNQTYADFKLVISDDGSTDGSREVCLAYAKQDPRIEYVRQPDNLGISRNMMFLLSCSNSPYFMWAADDDLWDPYFCERLIHLLEESPEAIGAFCSYQVIDEQGKPLRKPVFKDYSHTNTKRRLVNYIKDADDTFGYGLYRTDKIKNVKFPVWRWPNKNTPYNNIYPTLAYYLSKGNMVFLDELLFFKREKSEKNTNHPLIGSGNGLWETFAFIMRRFNLVVFTLSQIAREQRFIACLRYVFPLFYYWFCKSVKQQLSLAFNAAKRKLK